MNKCSVCQSETEMYLNGLPICVECATRTEESNRTTKKWSVQESMECLYNHSL
jgi:hypothetical protein